MALDELKRRKTVSRIGNTQVTEYSGVPKKGIAPQMNLAPINPYKVTKAKKSTPKRVMPPVAEPEYFTKENSGGMGWQERIARNKDLASNYRTALTTQTQSNVAGTTAGSAANVAALRNTGNLAVRGLQEEGLGGRQATQQAHEASLQQQRIGAQQEAVKAGQSFQESQAGTQRDFQLGRDEANREAGLVSGRERDALGLLKSGALTDESQFSNYATFGPQGIRGLNIPSGGKQKSYKYVPPVVKTDLRGESNVVVPPGTFDPSTGTTKYDVKDLPTGDLDKMIQALLKRKTEKE